MYPPSVECNRIFTKDVTVLYKTKLKVNNLNATYLDQNVFSMYSTRMYYMLYVYTLAHTLNN